jgi:hypothetical protein
MLRVEEMIDSSPQAVEHNRHRCVHGVEYVKRVCCL